MATAARVALRPNNEAPRRSWQTERGTVNFQHCDNAENSTETIHPQSPGRIIAMHWLRPDMMEAANG